jgi:hypothetical protein
VRLTRARLRHLARAVAWAPAAVTAVAATAVVALVPNPSPLTVSTVAAAVGATAAFALDDPAAVTLASSPATLARRVAWRVSTAMLLLAGWWAAVVVLAASRRSGVPVVAYSAQVGAVAAIGLAGAAWVAHTGREGGLVGAVGALACYGASFLPVRLLHVLPADPTAPGAGRHLAVVFAVALAVMLLTSADPAHRRLVT